MPGACARLLRAVLAASVIAEGRSRPQHRTECVTAKEGDEIVVDCGGQFISQIKFASYGMPQGKCVAGQEDQSFTIKSSCHSSRSEAVVEERCLGQTTCMFTVTADLFGGDPCPSVEDTKRVAAVLGCGDSLTSDTTDTVPEPVRPPHYGWKFIFFVFFVFGLYITLGVVYNIKRMGASGLDALPHREMWRDLPFLVRDGIFFTVDTIKSKGKSQYESYL